MIISLKTENGILLTISEIPIVGAIILFIISMAPLPFLFIANLIFQFTDTESIERINVFVSAFWNLILSFGFRTTISVLFIPCWAFYLIIGVLTYLGMLGD